MLKSVERTKRKIIKRVSGGGMIEVLVAILIVAFAMLGMAGLQVSSLRYQKTAHLRGMAAQYAAEIGDRIRANMAGAAANKYVTADSEKYAEGYGTDPGICADDTKCSAAEVAARDIYNWRLNLDSGIKGWGEITGAHPSFTVMVYFREPNKKDYDNSIDAGCRIAALDSTDTEVRCLSYVVSP